MFITFYIAIYNYEDLNLFNTIISFSIPVIYCILNIPLIYFFQLYVKYESLYFAISCRTPNDKKIKRNRILNIIWVCNYSVKKILFFKKEYVHKIYISMPDKDFKLLLNKFKYEYNKHLSSLK